MVSAPRRLQIVFLGGLLLCMICAYHLEASSDTTFSKIRIIKKKDSGKKPNEPEEKDPEGSSCLESILCGTSDEPGCCISLLKGLFSGNSTGSITISKESAPPKDRISERREKLARLESEFSPMTLFFGGGAGQLIFPEIYEDPAYGLSAAALFRISPTFGFKLKSGCVFSTGNPKVHFERDIFIGDTLIGRRIFYTSGATMVQIPLIVDLNLLIPAELGCFYIAFGGGIHYRHETTRGEIQNQPDPRRIPATVRGSSVHPVIDLSSGWILDWFFVDLSLHAVSHTPRNRIETLSDNSDQSHTFILSVGYRTSL